MLETTNLEKNACSWIPPHRISTVSKRLIGTSTTLTGRPCSNSATPMAACRSFARSGRSCGPTSYQRTCITSRTWWYDGTAIAAITSCSSSTAVRGSAATGARAGTHIHVPFGATFGPIVAGPEGATAWELSFGEFGGWGDEQALYDREIEARGVTPLPDPPLDLGDWFKDPRNDVGAERGVAAASTVWSRPSRRWINSSGPRSSVRETPMAASRSIREKWPIAQPDFMTAYIEYDPGMISAPPWALRSPPRVGHRRWRVVR